jgi:hypothetical protein
MKLLQELSEDVEYELIEEAEGNSKNYYLKGIFMQGDIKNGNGRIYPINHLSSAVKKYNEEYVDRRRALGELGHPNTPSLNYERASHLITELKQDGSNIIGKAKVLDTPMGKIAKALMDEKCVLGISSRGLG